MKKHNIIIFFLLSVTILLFIPATSNHTIVQAYDDVIEDSQTNDNITTVYTYPDLIDALTKDNGYHTIYLGADIIADTTDGIAIHDSKVDVIIDGHSPKAPDGKNYTFTQYDIDNPTSAIYIETTNTTTQSITIRNIEVEGANFNGVVFIPETSSGVTVLYQNMIYTGPQAVTNRSGVVHFDGCTFTMEASKDRDPEELAEANHIEMSGKIEITSSAPVSLFWLTNINPCLLVMESADVTITIDGFFLYADDDTNSPDIHILSNATFNITSKSGFTQLGKSIQNMFIEMNASVFITQNSPLTHASLRIEQVFQMQPNSTLIIVRMIVPGVALHFPIAGGQAIFNDPKRVVLFSLGQPSISFTDEGDLQISTTCINVWQDITTGFGEPTFIWNNIEGKPFSLTNHYLDTIPQKIEHTLDENAPITVPLDETTFDLEEMALLTFGHIDLTIDPLFTSSKHLTGNTDTNTQISISYTTIDGQPRTFTGSTDENGNFIIPLEPNTLEAESTASVTATVGMVSIRRLIKVIQMPAQQLSFSSIPDNMDFSGILIPSSSATIPRDDDNFSFSIIDTRDTPDAWHIDLSISTPLTATLSGSHHELHNALIFVDKDGNITPLTNVPLTIYTNSEPRFGYSHITWEATEGVLLQVAPGVAYSNVPYTTTIQWSLVSGP